MGSKHSLVMGTNMVQNLHPFKIQNQSSNHAQDKCVAFQDLSSQQKQCLNSSWGHNLGSDQSSMGADIVSNQQNYSSEMTKNLAAVQGQALELKQA